MAAREAVYQTYVVWRWMVLQLERRRFLWVAAVGLALPVTLSCATSPAPIPKPEPIAPTTTTKSASPATAQASGTPAPTTPGPPQVTPQQAARPTFQPARARVLTTAGPTQGVIRTLVGQLGYYRDFGLEVQREEIADASKQLAAVVAGEAELGDGGLAQVFLAIHQGADLKLIGSHYKLVSLVIYAIPEIKSLKDLEGKAIGVSAPGALLHVVALASLKKMGVDPSKVTFANVGGSPAVFQAVAARKVEAGVSQTSFLRAAKDQGIQVLAEIWKILPDYVNTGFFTSEKTIAQRRDVLVRMMAAYAKTFNFIKGPESKTAFLEVAVKNYGLKAEDAESEWQWTREHDALAYDLALTPTQVSFMQQTNIDVGFEQQILPFDRVVDTTIARDALALLKG